MSILKITGISYNNRSSFFFIFIFQNKKKIKKAEAVNLKVKNAMKQKAKRRASSRK